MYFPSDVQLMPCIELAMVTSLQKTFRISELALLTAAVILCLPLRHGQNAAKESAHTCRRFAYRVRPGSHKKVLPKGADASNAQYVFRTARPADYSTPYDTMLKHGVQFTAVERQQNLFITVAVRARPLSRTCSLWGGKMLVDRERAWPWDLWQPAELVCSCMRSRQA